MPTRYEINLEQARINSLCKKWLPTRTDDGAARFIIDKILRKVPILPKVLFPISWQEVWGDLKQGADLREKFEEIYHQ